MALDFTNLATRQANSRSSTCAAVGAFRVTTRNSPAATILASGVCTRNPPPTRLKSQAAFFARGAGNAISSTRTLTFRLIAASASSVNPGAISTSRNCAATVSTVAASIGRLKAMMPPNADTGSVATAFLYASIGVSAIATPQGFACLTMTHAGSANVFTHSQAASLSAMLLYESSLPCSCRKLAMLPASGASSR